MADGRATIRQQFYLHVNSRWHVSHIFLVNMWHPDTAIDHTRFTAVIRPCECMCCKWEVFRNYNHHKSITISIPIVFIAAAFITKSPFKIVALLCFIVNFLVVHVMIDEKIFGMIAAEVWLIKVCFGFFETYYKLYKWKYFKAVCLFKLWNIYDVAPGGRYRKELWGVCNNIWYNQTVDKRMNNLLSKL